MTDTFKLHDNVAWTMFDGNTMTGTIDAMTALSRSAYIIRVDGGLCGPVDKRQLRHATEEDVVASIGFFGRIGKCVA